MMESFTGLITGPATSPNKTTEIQDQSKIIDRYLQQARILKSNKEFSFALALLRSASSLDPKHFQVLNLLGEVLAETGRRSELLLVRKAIKLNFPDFSTSFQYAQELYHAGDRDDEALKAYFETLSLLDGTKIELFEIYKNMGNISVKLRDYDGAEEFYNKAYTLNSLSDTLLVNFGTLEIQRGNFEKAIYCFREAIKVNSKNDKAWVGLALMHNEYGDHSLAWANLTSALDLESYNRTAVLLCARWAVREKRESFSIKVLEKFLEKENFDEEISLALIGLYCQFNYFTKAQYELTKILAWNPNLPAAREIESQLQQFPEVA